jgi:hypothetical protein
VQVFAQGDAAGNVHLTIAERRDKAFASALRGASDHMVLGRQDRDPAKLIEIYL